MDLTHVPTARSIRTSALHPVGFDPYLCCLSWDGGQSILPHDVLQHVSGSRCTRYIAAANGATADRVDRGAIIGRTVPLWMSDRNLGPINTIILMNILTFVTVLAIWLPFGALTVPALYVVVVFMGIGTGSFVPLGGSSSLFHEPSPKPHTNMYYQLLVSVRSASRGLLEPGW